MIDLEDGGVAVCGWWAIGGGVEACAEYDVLADAAGNCAGELIFGVAAAHDHVGANTFSDARLEDFGVFVNFGDVVADDWDGQGIVEDFGVVEELMSSAAKGHAECGAAWGEFFHEDLSI